MKRWTIFLSVLFVMLFSANVVFSADVKLTVGNGSGCPATVNITAEPVSGSTSVAGVAFTLRYDSSLTVSVENNTFFDTFIAQGYTAGQDGLDSSGRVDGFDSPFVTNEETESGSGKKLTRIAAARHTAGTISSPTVLFVLTISGATNDTYDIELIPTSLDNTDAGYSASGENIDLAIGAEAVGSPDEFPVRLSAAEAVSPNVVNGSVTIECTLTDTDGDGIDDNWENANFGDLNAVNATSDYDQDGYSDLVEWQNSENGENDPEGHIYEAAKWKNVPNGTGYNETTRVIPGDIDGTGAPVFISDLQRAYKLFNGDIAPTPQEFSAANVYDDSDNHAFMTIHDLQGVYKIFNGDPL